MFEWYVYWSVSVGVAFLLGMMASSARVKRRHQQRLIDMENVFTTRLQRVERERQRLSDQIEQLGLLAQQHAVAKAPVSRVKPRKNRRLLPDISESSIPPTAQARKAHKAY